jgi:hypothetical protein
LVLLIIRFSVHLLGSIFPLNAICDDSPIIDQAFDI